MAKKNEILADSQLTKEGQGSLTPKSENNSLCQEGEPKDQQRDKLSESTRVATKRGRPKRRKRASLKSSLDKLLSMEIAPSSVADEVKGTPLGENITYQEAILIAQILKATRGDNQAITFLQKLIDIPDKEEKSMRLEDFIV